MKYIQLILLVVGLLFAKAGISQIHYQPYSYEQYQRNMGEIYADSLTHTAVKPFVGTNIDPRHAIMQPDTTRSWGYRKLFQEHLIEVVKDDHMFYLDFMPDFIIGAERGTNSKTLWTNTRGAQAGLSVNNKFSLFVSFYENQARYASFIDSTALRIGNLPGQGFSKNLNTGKYDWMSATANMSYHFADALQVTLAYDKLHIGEGYRSVLISDNPYNYTHARLSGTVGRWQYHSIWAYMNDLRNPRVTDIQDPLSGRLGNGVKYGAFQYVDYRAGDKVSLGLFHSLIWAQKNKGAGGKANGGLGLNVKYQPWQKYVFYGQLYADDISKFGFGSSDNHRMAFQLGGKTYDLFDVANLNVTAEYNQAAPYTYQHPNNRINYTSNGEALAHPRGANFREVLGIATYRWNRWEVYGQTMYARYGLDPTDSDNVGVDLFKEEITADGFRIAQGNLNNLFYHELRFSYVMNPKYNLRWELGLIDRRNKNTVTGDYQHAAIFTFGLRSSFRTFQREY
ncbi:gliding motility protein RemB [Sphingobacterium sp. DN00404]|uniref:Gliding motility protein RemB n=1 Tax=Sphingobacterium micropteri TaxID=2763501 RepID=A0ABR7YKH4_9SPHI|nr:gliding motility protein RemB [Sphingobacterium micropteri]MBD1431830.1 gliding motility protein RemB [Sphingobacterium micropteri]